MVTFKGVSAAGQLHANVHRGQLVPISSILVQIPKPILNFGFYARMYVQVSLTIRGGYISEKYLTTRDKSGILVSN
jgi:hypothetical protein